MRVRVIINPVAGRYGRRPTTGVERQQIARAWLASRAITGEVVLTTRAGHAVELSHAFAADRIDRVIAWGGDGTINEVSGPLIGSNTVLGLVPGGSGDGLAGGLGIPADPAAALALAVDGHVARLDVGWLGDRHFLNAGGVGFDAVVADAFSRRRARGLVGYLLAGLGSAFSYRSATYTVDLDGTVSTGPRFLVAFGNGRQYGNGFVLAPDADPTDGLLDAVIVEGGSPLRQLWRGRRLFFAPEKPQEGVRRQRIRRARIASAIPLRAHVDGEPFVASSELSVRVEPGALAVAMPPRARGG